jgi:hypothetical protein
METEGVMGIYFVRCTSALGDTFHTERTAPTQPLLAEADLKIPKELNLVRNNLRMVVLPGMAKQQILGRHPRFANTELLLTSGSEVTLDLVTLLVMSGLPERHCFSALVFLSDKARHRKMKPGLL